MRILFLDIDGCVNSVPRIPGHDTDTKLWDRIITICKQTGCNIVISSSWGLNSVIEEIGKEASDPEFLKEIILGHTPLVNLGHMGKHITLDEIENNPNVWDFVVVKERMAEILLWIQTHEPVDNWIAVDDLPLEFPSNHFVKTDHDMGITDALVDEAIVKLMG